MSRVTTYPIEPLFIERWSARAFDEGVMPEKDLFTILEAARWAPSSFNLQPWRFIYARRGDKSWSGFVDLLNPFNRSWAQRSSALVVLLSDSLVKEAEGEAAASLNGYASFDAGAAWMQLALQAYASGYRTHAMAGIDFARTRELLKIPERYKIEIIVAIGKRTDPKILPDALQEREKPSERLSLDQIAFHELWPGEEG